jgi:hypothetical protein
LVKLLAGAVKGKQSIGELWLSMLKSQKDAMSSNELPDQKH